MEEHGVRNEGAFTVNKETDGKQRTYRNSRQRQAILTVIQNGHSHLSAEDIYEQVRLVYPRISLGTVYRNLDILSEQGRIHRITFADGKSRFEVADDHHHHLICLLCGSIEDLPQCPMDPEMKQYISETGFQPVKHQFEIYGYCNRCQRRDCCPLHDAKQQL